MSSVEILIILGSALFFGIVCTLVADSKGRNCYAWGIGGFFLGILALLILACLSNEKLLKEIREIKETKGKST